MPTGIIQPSNVIKLTNVSLVRLKKGKKRFELACYKNKVLEYRNGTETDLDNVLQIHSIFLNVSKGQLAPAADVVKAFGQKTNDEVILEIMQKGEIQVGEKERAAQIDRVHHEVISIVASKLVDPRTKRVYTTGMIEKALEMISSGGTQQGDKSAAGSGTGTPATGEEGEAVPKSGAGAHHHHNKPHGWTGVVPTKSAKSQALEAMKALIAHQPIPVARARMKLRITCPTGILKMAVKSAAPKLEAGAGEGEGEGGEEKAKGTVKDRILSFVEQVESQDVLGSEWEVVGFVEPGAYKGLCDFIGNETKGQGRVEVLDMAVMHEED